MIRPTHVLALSILATIASPSLTALAEDSCPAAVTIQRAHSDESAELRLVDCDGAPNLEALDELSMLGRPTGTPRPSPEAMAVFQTHAPEARRERFVSPGVHRLDAGLLVRLHALAARFDHKPLSIVSGYRPHARRGSRHRVGRALDVQVVGVPRREVALFARSLPETGVGYYPNSTFTHIDVREASHHWVDRSGPGEAPQYVAWGATLEESGDPAQETGERDEPAEVDGAPVVATSEVPAAVAPNVPVAAVVTEPAPPTASRETPDRMPAEPDAVAVADSLEAELDDTGAPLDLAATSAAARDAIRAHRDAAFQQLTAASDDEVDWSLPWW